MPHKESSRLNRQHKPNLNKVEFDHLSPMADSNYTLLSNLYQKLRAEYPYVFGWVRSFAEIHVLTSKPPRDKLLFRPDIDYLGDPIAIKQEVLISLGVPYGFTFEFVQGQFIEGLIIFDSDEKNMFAPYIMLGSTALRTNNHRTNYHELLLKQISSKYEAPSSVNLQEFTQGLLELIKAMDNLNRHEDKWMDILSGGPLTQEWVKRIVVFYSKHPPRRVGVEMVDDIVVALNEAVSRYLST